MRTRQFVSVDKVVILADIKADAFAAWFEEHKHTFLNTKSAKTRWGYDLYANSWICPDGTHVSTHHKLTNSHEIRIELSPNREPLYEKDGKDITIPLLSCLTYAQVTRIDVAIDYLGYRLTDWEILCPRLKKSIESKGYGFPKSYTFGSKRSKHQIIAYDKDGHAKAKNRRILGVLGELVVPDKDTQWMRIEARTKGSSLLRGNAFSALIMFKKASFKKPANMREARTQVFACAAMNYGYMDYFTQGMSENTRTRWRQEFLNSVTLLKPHPQEIYEQNYEYIKDRVATMLAPIGQNMTEETKLLLRITKDYPHDLFN